MLYETAGVDGDAQVRARFVGVVPAWRNRLAPT
jgi:hypothetical protein